MTAHTWFGGFHLQSRSTHLQSSDSSLFSWVSPCKFHDCALSYITTASSPVASGAEFTSAHIFRGHIGIVLNDVYTFQYVAVLVAVSQNSKYSLKTNLLSVTVHSSEGHIRTWRTCLNGRHTYYSENIKLSIWRLSDVKGTSVFYMWPAGDTSMSLAFVGTSGREVAALVSLFSIPVCELCERTKWPVWLKIIATLRSAQ
jgi:hypothetical protein